LKTLFAVALILLFTGFAFAQRNFQQPAPYSPQLTAELKQLQEAALKSDYAWDQLAHLTNNIGPRPAGSAQANFAAQYVAGELRKLGLEVKLEKVVVPHWQRGEETAALVEFPGMAPGTTQKVVLTALGGSVATPAQGVTAEVVVVNILTNWLRSAATKSRARSFSSITSLINSWPQPVMAGPRTARP
jgi:hypothetical protein